MAMWKLSGLALAAVLGTGLATGQASAMPANGLASAAMETAATNGVQDVRFSNRPFGVKRFQTIHHHCSVDVTHGLVLLFGIGTKALPSWDSRTRWNNLFRGLTVID